MTSGEVHKTIAKLTGMESNDSVRTYKTKAGAIRRLETLLAANPEFFFHYQRVDATPGAIQPTYGYAVFVDHPSLYGFNNPSAPSARPCV